MTYNPGGVVVPTSGRGSDATDQTALGMCAASPMLHIRFWGGRYQASATFIFRRRDATQGFPLPEKGM